MNPRSPVLKAALLSLSLLTILTGAAIAPTLGSIARAFPQASPASVQMVLTLPSLFIMVVSILTGRLASRMSERVLLLAGLCLYMVGGLAGRFAPGIGFLLATRAVLGIGVGIISPLSVSLIADFYSGRERAQMMGWSQSARSLTGVVVAPLVGTLATADWRNVFWVYLLGFAVFLVTLVWIPDPKTTIQRFQRDGTAEPVLQPPAAEIAPERFEWKAVWLLALAMVLQRIGFYMMPANLSLHMAAYNLGGSALAGWAIAADTLASFVIGLAFASLLKTFRRYLGMLSLALMALGYGVLAAAEGTAGLMAAMALIGFAEGLLMPLLLYLAAQSVPAAQRTLAIGLVGSMQFLGQFLTPYAAAALGWAARDSATRTLFWSTGILLAAAAALGTVVSLRVPRREAKTTDRAAEVGSNPPA
ncbi:MAG: MFS transporter [Anaerolineae bacterium]|nr:MFS transporter [Anaerolineae bacterium]